MTPPKIENAPGLTWRPHRAGWVARWQCRSDIGRRGYEPRTERLWFGSEPDETQIAFIQDRCNVLQNAMLVWGRGGVTEITKFNGTVTGLLRCYQVDPDSPFRKLRYYTRVYYDVLCRKIEAQFGEKMIGELTAREIKHWHEAMAEAGKVSMAHAMIGMLRTVVNFGASILEDAACESLSSKLRKMRFAMGKSRVEQLSAEQANIVRAGAHAAGKPSIALAQAFQFECTFRQKDVIGEWVPLSEKTAPTSVLWGNSKWLRGITWQEIDQSLRLTHVTSKRQKEITVDLKLAPMVLDELDLAYPGWGRDRSKLPATGPIVISEQHGVPWSANEFRRQWRLIATKGGIPKTVRNMDSRAGAISEATDAGADIEHVRQAATHSDIAMTQKYSRNSDFKVAGVQVKRVAFRQNKSGNDGA